MNSTSLSEIACCGVVYPQVLARLLCGISSPQLSREKLGKHPLFGALQQLSFKAVLMHISG
ncbi:hypothetical protein MNBD_GAMMA18-1344 [hydrothermal vent metagenome]|uniref:Uncharacterized protein n=1 Tax=hydrothermal vent metagenome TaxID=652676 RepID=A0A3B0YU63_9ZZZZ